MVECDYCCIRPSCLLINCYKCSPHRSFHLCLKCSSNVQLFDDHWKDHSNSNVNYQFEDVPLNENLCSNWLSIDELNLIEMIETCGLGNWIDIGTKLQRKSLSCEKHFEEIYLSRQLSFYSISFERIQSKKLLHGETKRNSNREKDFQSDSIIYPLMLINNEEQKCLTYMPYRDEYEREFDNQSEYNLPRQLSFNEQDETNHLFDENLSSNQLTKTLLQQSKLILCRSYSHRLNKRIQLKHFIRDYALAFAFSQDQKFDLHQISRFLSSDQYERLIYNHRKIEQILDEFGCSSSSTSSSRLNHSTRIYRRKRSSNSNFIKEKSPKFSRNHSNTSFKSPPPPPPPPPTTTTTTVKRERDDDEEDESLTCQSTFSSTTNRDEEEEEEDEEEEEMNRKCRRRSRRRISLSSRSSCRSSSPSISSSSSSSMSMSEEILSRSSSTTSSRLTKDSSLIDERMARRSIYPSDHQNSLDKTCDPSNLFSSSNSSSMSNDVDQSSMFISSRTRSHPSSPEQQKKCSFNGQKSSKLINGSSSSSSIRSKKDPKSKNRMLTRQQYSIKDQRSTSKEKRKRKRILSNSFDE